jgi:GT2 family glycosyltransferase
MLAIIYVYYNSADVIFTSIKSLLSNKTTVDYEIIIVINKCTDIEINQLTNYSKKIRVIINNKNLGFGKACNIGAKNTDVKYLLFLNPDTIVEENVLEQMYKKMENDERIGISVCKLLTSENQVQKNVIYKKYNLFIIISELFFLFKIPLLKKIVLKNFYNKIDFEKEQFPKIISGAFMFFRKSAFNKINGFDEDFFMYGEDKDISLRTGKEYKLYYNPDVIVYHIGDSSLGIYPSIHKLTMMYSNQLLNVEKNFGRFQKYFLKFLYIINAFMFFPISFLMKNKIYRPLLKNRSIVFLKLFFSKI